MAHRFAQIAFTPAVRNVQEEMGSARQYERFLAEGDDINDRLTDNEASFISARNSFYLASVNEDGWPYIQHRGGPKGFVRVLDEQTLGFVDFKGNRQYLTVGNTRLDDRVSLFFMDYPNRRRLKLLGRLRDTNDESVIESLHMPDYKAKVERAMLIHVEAFDWNCPQHITPRYTQDELESLLS